MTAAERTKLAQEIADELTDRGLELRRLTAEARTRIAAADASLVEIQAALGLVIRSASISDLRPRASR